MKFLLIVICMINTLAFEKKLAADDVYIIIMKKQEAKKQSRWTLASWLATKEKMHLMDQWLALNTNPASIFELSLGGEYSSYKPTIHYNNTEIKGDTINAKIANLGFYISIFGIDAQYKKLEGDNSIQKGKFNIRLLGSSTQSTNLTLNYGLIKRKEEQEFTNQLAGGALTIYLFDWLGISGAYDYYFKKTNDANIELKGHEINATTFLELAFIRIYGKWWQETLKYKNYTIADKTVNAGISYGLKLIF